MNRLVKLKKITAKIGSGATPRGGQNAYQTQGISLIRSQNVLDFRFSMNGLAFINEDQAESLNNVTVEDGDILLNITGDSIARVCIVPSEILPARVNQHVAIIRCNDEVDNKYVFYYLQYMKSYLLKICGVGGTRNALTKEALEKLDIVLQDNQKARAAVLWSLDSKIELNNKINAELEAMAKTLYDYWFVQFDFPDKDGKPYKTSGGKMVWNDELKREIPDGWEVGKIGSVFNTYLGGTPSTSVPEYWDNGTISWLNSGEIANFPIIDSELKITKAAIGNSATTLLPKGSVLLSITRHLRPSVLAVDACANQSVVGIKEKEDFRYYYLYPYLQNEIPRLNTMRSGAQQPHINKEIVDESLIVIPNSSILKMYNSKVAHTYEFIMNNAFQNQTLSELRDWLLPMLMNGQVTVT